MAGGDQYRRGRSRRDGGERARWLAGCACCGCWCWCWCWCRCRCWRLGLLVSQRGRRGSEASRRRGAGRRRGSSGRCVGGSGNGVRNQGRSHTSRTSDGSSPSRPASCTRMTRTGAYEPALSSRCLITEPIPTITHPLIHRRPQSAPLAHQRPETEPPRGTANLNTTPTHPYDSSGTVPSPQRPPRPHHTPSQGGPPEQERLSDGTADLLEHPDPHTVAEAATVENLLRCWVRETGFPSPDNGILRIPLPASGISLLVPVRYWSPTGWHRFGLPRVAGAPEQAPPADAVTVAALLTRESAAAHTAASGTELTARVADSVRRTATFVRERRKHTDDGPDLFLTAEQALVLGHPLHPAPKSREGLSEAEGASYSPELRGFFLCTGSPSVPPSSPLTRPGPNAVVPSPPLSSPDVWPALTCSCPTVTRLCRCTLGSSVRSGTAPKSPRCSMPDYSETWVPTAPRGIRPPPSARSIAPALLPCSSSRWACASPTPAVRTSARNSTVVSRCTGYYVRVCPRNGRRPTPHSTSSATLLGSPSMRRTATPYRVSTW